MEALAVVTATTSALAAAGALFNGWQIARLAGRVDALGTDVRAINTHIDKSLLADRSRAPCAGAASWSSCATVGATRGMVRPGGAHCES